MIQQLQALPGREAQEIAALEVKRRDLQMRRHLERFKINAGKISGVGEARKLTLRSYGIDLGKDASRKRSGKLHRQLLEVLPPSHRDFLESTRLSEVVGDYFFVHAGARPGVPLDRQDEADLLWIRDACYGAPERFDKVLVHGHTPRRRPENLPGRINVDTGAFKWGVLSCVALEGQERRFLSTGD